MKKLNVRNLWITCLTMVCWVVMTVSGAHGQELIRVSEGIEGNPGNNMSTFPSVSYDGKQVVFASAAGNLVYGDTNGAWDVFVYDGQTGTIERVSVKSSGEEAGFASFPYHTPSISDDGRYVAFSYGSDTLVTGDGNGMIDIYVHDRLTRLTERVSVDSSGNEAEKNSLYPTISGDGRYVVFSSFAANLTAGDTNNASDVFLHDRMTGSTEVVSIGYNGYPGNGHSLFPSISGDGNSVVFVSRASNLVEGDTNGWSDVFVHDLESGVTERVSVDSYGAQVIGAYYRPQINYDGRYIAYSSDTGALADNDVNGMFDVFVHDRETGLTEMLTTGLYGEQGNGNSYVKSIDAEGRYVAFTTYATNLVPGDTNNVYDVMLYDRVTGATKRMSTDTNGGQADRNSMEAALGGDSSFIAFSSWATNIYAGDTNGLEDVFLVDNRDAGIENHVEINEDPPVIIEAAVDIKPDTLNRKSRSRKSSVTVYLEVEGEDLGDIDVQTVTMRTGNGVIFAQLTHSETGDYNKNGIPDLMVKFDRQELIVMVDEGGFTEAKVSGTIGDREFEGTDGIKVIQ